MSQRSPAATYAGTKSGAWRASADGAEFRAALQARGLDLRQGRKGPVIVDGTGAEPFEADIAVVGGKIAAIGRNLNAGKEEIDAKGKVVAPGFIDVHTHDDTALIDPGKPWQNGTDRITLCDVSITRTSAVIATVCVASAGLGVWLASPAGRNVPLLNMLSVISLSVGVITTARDATFCWQHGRKRLAVLRALTDAILATLMLLPISRML